MVTWEDIGLHEATQSYMRQYTGLHELHGITLEATQPHATFCKPNVASSTSVQPHVTLCRLM